MKEEYFPEDDDKEQLLQQVANEVWSIYSNTPRKEICSIIKSLMDECPECDYWELKDKAIALI